MLTKLLSPKERGEDEGKGKENRGRRKRKKTKKWERTKEWEKGNERKEKSLKKYKDDDLFKPFNRTYQSRATRRFYRHSNFTDKHFMYFYNNYTIRP